MHKIMLFKIRQLNRLYCDFRFTRKKFSILSCTDLQLQNKLLSSISHHLYSKRISQRVDNVCKNYSVLLQSNKISDKFGLYHLPQFIVSRGIKTSSCRFGENDELSHLFLPVKYEASECEEGVGEDIVGPLNREQILSIIREFNQNKVVKELAKEQGLDDHLFLQTVISFRKYCYNTEKLPTELHIILNDIKNESSHIHDIYPYFYKHAKDIFPHLSCMDELYKVCDLTQPPNWYSNARAMKRKIIFHAGPTNSGKTYHAMERFLSSESGVYCGPLKLLAVEVHEKSNTRGTPCDLVTGEERKFAISEEFPASHISCTVEMTSVDNKYDVAVIDEIQMIKDPLRGWAWTRAFLGLCASEIHVCGEASAIDLIKELAMSVGEDFEVRQYKRLTPLHLEDKALQSIDKIKPGDCIVCFGRQAIHKISQAIEKLGHEVAVIYGGLPPGTKLAQAKKFNDPNHPCKIMVATDAIGMGLNLSIRRVIFSSLEKPNVNEKGEKTRETISVSSALQIAGRAGRFGTMFSEGYVTTWKSSDLPILGKLLNSTPPDIAQAGLHPTAEQIELFAYHLPNYNLSCLVDIFVKMCTMDSSMYFMCMLEDFKFLAELLQHVELPLRARYVFCCSPISRKMSFVCAIFVKFAKQFSTCEPVTFHWLCSQVNGPFGIPKTIEELVHLEQVFDVFDLYLWLSYRFPDMFPDVEMVRSSQQQLDTVIQQGVAHITQLLKQSDELKKKPIHFKIHELANIFKDKNKTLNLSSRSGNLKAKRKKTLAESLVKKGIISHKQLMELQAEMKNEKAESVYNSDDELSRIPSKRKC